VIEAFLKFAVHKIYFCAQNCPACNRSELGTAQPAGEQMELL
jgi:hypothetical protein